MKKHYIFILLYLIFAWLVLTARYALATTYYVSTTGSDANTCTLAQTAATGKGTIGGVAGALFCASAGDTIIVKAGTYYERVNVSKSGTAGNPITIKGERDANNNWLTIIDGSTALTTWTLATDTWTDSAGAGTFVGTGVYRAAKPTFTGPITGTANDSCSLTADGKDVWHIAYSFTDGGSTPQEGSPSWQRAMAKAPTDSAWRGIGGLFANKGSYIYLRFTNKDDPNAKSIRVAPWNQHCTSGYTPDFGVFNLAARSYITISDLELQGTASAITTSGAANNNIFEKNKIHAAMHNIFLFGGSGNVVNNNTFYGNSIGFDTAQDWVPGVWAGYYQALGGKYTVRSNMYNKNKYLVGTSDQVLWAVSTWNAATGTTISNNEAYYYNGFVFLNAGTGYTISNNYFHNSFGSAIYFGPTIGAGTMTIADNRIEDTDTPLRSNYLDTYGTGLTIYIYRNKIWSPVINTYSSARLAYWSLYSAGQNNTAKPTVIMYHNTLIGGNHGVTFIADVNSKYPNFTFVNNLMQLSAQVSDPYSHYDYYNDTFYNWSPCSTSGFVKAADYNWWFGQSIGSCVWKGSHNVKETAKIFADTNPPASYTPTGSALAAGIDISAPFTLNGISYSALPGFSPGYFDGAAPDVGAVQVGGTPPPIPEPETSWTATDNFDSYTLGANLDTLNGGSGSWAGAWRKDPYNEFVGDGDITVETAPSGMSGKAIRSSGTADVYYVREINPISAGDFQIAAMLTATPNNRVEISLTNAVDRFVVGRVRWDTDNNFKIQNGAAYDTVGPYTNNVVNIVEVQFDRASQPDKWRTRIDNGTWSAWTSTLASWTALGSVRLRDSSSNAMDVWWDVLGLPGTAPVGTINVVTPITGTRYKNTETIPITWNTTGITGAVNIDYSLNGGAFWYRVANGVAYNATYNWILSGMPRTSHAMIQVSQGSIVARSGEFSISGRY